MTRRFPLLRHLGRNNSSRNSPFFPAIFSLWTLWTKWIIDCEDCSYLPAGSPGALSGTVEELGTERTCWALRRSADTGITGVASGCLQSQEARAIAEAPAKTDNVDGRTLADLLRCRYISEIRQPSPFIPKLRSLIATRENLVGARTQYTKRARSPVPVETPQTPPPEGTTYRKVRSRAGVCERAGIPRPQLDSLFTGEEKAVAGLREYIDTIRRPQVEVKGTWKRKSSLDPNKIGKEPKIPRSGSITP